MAEETKVRVKLDTSQAAAQLGEFVREGARASSAIGGSISASMRRGFEMVGLGGAIGGGIAAVRGATQSGIGDVVGEAFGGIGAQLSEFFLGDLDEKARAARRAREETTTAFGAIAGIRGAVPPEARNFFAAVQRLRVQEERGRELFARDEQFRGPGMGEIIDRVMARFGELIAQAVDKLAEKLNPFG